MVKGLSKKPKALVVSKVRKTVPSKIIGLKTTPYKIVSGDKKSSLKFKATKQSKKIQIFGERGSYKDVGKLISKVKIISKKFKTKEIVAMVDPMEDNDIRTYLLKGFTSKIRYINGKIQMVYIEGKKKITSASRTKVMEKIYTIKNGILSGGFVPIQVTLDPELLLFMEKLLNEPVEYAGTMRLTNKKFNSATKKYKFVAKRSKVVKGSNTQFISYVPVIEKDQKEFVSFHTHPKICYAKHGSCIAPPSDQDYQAITLRCLMLNEAAHFVITPESVYTMELIIQVRALGRMMTHDEKVLFAKKAHDLVTKEMEKVWGLCYMVNDIILPIRRAGGKVNQVGEGPNLKFILNYRGKQTVTNSIYELFDKAKEQGINIKFNQNTMRRRRERFLRQVSEPINKITIANMGIQSIIDKYGITDDISKIPIFSINAHHIDVGGAYYTHNYRSPITIEIQQDITLMKPALSKSKSIHSFKRSTNKSPEFMNTT